MFFGNGFVSLLVEDIEPDDEFVWTLHFDVKDDARGTIVNRSRLVLIPDDPTKPPFEVDSNEVIHIPAPIVKSSPTKTYRVGEDIVYDIRVALPTDMKGYDTLRIIDFYDHRLESPVSVSLTRNGVAVEDFNEMEVDVEGQVSLLIEDIAAEDVFVWTLRFTVQSGAEGVIVNVAKLIMMGEGLDDYEVPSNEVVHTPFEPPKVLKSSPTTTYRPGGIIRYDIEVTLPDNLDDYGGLRFEDIYDNRLEDPRFISLFRNGQEVVNRAGMVIGDGIVSIVINEFAPEDVFVWTLEFRVKANASGTIVNVARAVVIPVNPDDPEVDYPSNEVIHNPPRDFILKYNAQYPDQPVAGALIHIFNAQGEMVYETESDANGRAWIDLLPAGNYTFREIKAPEGYHLNSHTYRFTVAADGTITTDDPHLPHGKLEMPNIPELIDLLKIDGQGAALAGAHIEVMNHNNERIDIVISDANGIMRVRLTELGVYRFRETRAPDGFVLDETIYTFELRNDGRIDGKLTLVNHRQVNRQVPQTGVDSNRLILIVLLIIVGSTAIVVPTAIYRKEIVALFRKQQ
jgi:fimbrial isopeptide formation D2 family protein